MTPIPQSPYPRSVSTSDPTGKKKTEIRPQISEKYQTSGQNLPSKYRACPQIIRGPVLSSTTSGLDPHVFQFGYGPGSYGSTFPLFAGGSDRASTGLSKATGLKSVTPEHLRQILINVPSDFSPGSASVNTRRVIGETTYEQWSDLDRLLVRFWESHLIRPKMRHSGVSRREKKVIDYVQGRRRGD